MIQLKSDQEIELMRKAGKILAKVMQAVHNEVRQGITTESIDIIAEELIREGGAEPAFKNYRGFPASICASINEEIVHGIPSARSLKSGDIIGIDIGLRYEGYYSDIAVTIAVDQVDVLKKKLIDVTRKALAVGIAQAKVNNHLSDISYAIQSYVEKFGFSVVRQFVGHGIGHKLHEDPEIPNFGQPNQGPVLKTGMVFAIEPMVNAGTWECRILDNGWTAVTLDGKPSAHFEHTVAITSNGPEILTRYA